MPNRAAAREARLPQWAHEADRHAECAPLCKGSCRFVRRDGTAAGNAGVRKTSSQRILYGALAKRQALSTSSTSEQRLVLLLAGLILTIQPV